jgi:multidrug efflux pump subunit AcrA (membrane-fusion protein)
MKKGQDMRPKVLILLAVSGLFIQIACGEKQAAKQEASMQPVAATTLALRYESLPAVVQAPGTVQARNRVALSSQISGFVREMRVRVGDFVKKDQPLVSLDARDAQSQKAAAQAAIDESQAALSEARKAYQASVEMQTAAKAVADLTVQTLARYQKLAESHSVSPQELDEVRMRRNASHAELASREAMVAAAEERIKQVEARVAQAKAQSGRTDVLLSWSELKAPSSGRVVQRMVDPGTAVFPGTPLLAIESTDHPQVLVDIPTEHAHVLKIGSLVSLRFGDSANAPAGRISEIVPLSDPGTHSIQFKVDLPSNASMPSGQFVKVEVQDGMRDALLAPRTSVRQTGQLTGMFVVDSASKAHFRLVKIAPYDADRVEVLSGIDPGEKIVSALSDQIIDGIPITER